MWAHKMVPLLLHYLCQATKQYGSRIGSIPAGELFGEMSVTGRRRDATVVSLGWDRGSGVDRACMLKVQDQGTKMKRRAIHPLVPALLTHQGHPPLHSCQVCPQADVQKGSSCGAAPCQSAEQAVHFPRLAEGRGLLPGTVVTGTQVFKGVNRSAGIPPPPSGSSRSLTCGFGCGFEQGTRIYRRGSPVIGVYFLRIGSVVLTQRHRLRPTGMVLEYVLRRAVPCYTVSHTRRPLPVLAPRYVQAPMFFGEMSAVKATDEAGHMHDAVAHENCVVTFVPLHVFKALVLSEVCRPPQPRANTPHCACDSQPHFTNSTDPWHS